MLRNPSAVHAHSRYRDSGVEWLGEVPEHWEVRRLKDVGRLIAGAAFPEALQGVEGEELPFFKVGDLAKSVDGRWLDGSEHTINRETAAEIRARVIPRESVVYAKIGAALLLNRRRLTTRSACIDNNMSAYVPDRAQVATQWALYTLSLIDFREHVNPGAVPSLSEGDQAILPVPLPPLYEQRAIAAYLDRETQRIDALVAKKRLLIERLDEYRTALITRTVTRGLPPEAGPRRRPRPLAASQALGRQMAPATCRSTGKSGSCPASSTASTGGVFPSMARSARTGKATTHTGGLMEYSITWTIGSSMSRLSYSGRTALRSSHRTSR